MSGNYTKIDPVLARGLRQMSQQDAARAAAVALHRNVAGMVYAPLAAGVFMSSDEETTQEDLEDSLTYAAGAAITASTILLEKFGVLQRTKPEEEAVDDADEESPSTIVMP